MAKENKTKEQLEQESYWNKVRDFNLSRTPFWISILFELLETIIPFIVIWILIGADFKGKDFNFYNSLPGNKDGMVALISICTIIWSMGIAAITFFTRLQKEDVFTYTFTLAIIFFVIIMNGSWMVNWDQSQGLKIFTRFLICLFSFIPGIVIGVIITTLLRNWRYKVEEEDEAILIAYKKGEEVPTKQQLRIQRAEQARIQREKELQEIEEFKKELDKKLIESYDKKDEEIKSHKKTKEEIRQEKLDAKEAKKRAKAESRKEIKDLD